MNGNVYYETLLEKPAGTIKKIGNVVVAAVETSVDYIESHEKGAKQVGVAVVAGVTALAGFATGGIAFGRSKNSKTRLAVQ